MKDTNFSRAFTLAELLTAVLVISVIMVALAPVITKRMQENISVETDRKKGEEIWTNPGTYTFQAPVGINILEISGAGGGGGGAGAVMKNYSKTYSGSSTEQLPCQKVFQELHSPLRAQVAAEEEQTPKQKVTLVNIL